MQPHADFQPLSPLRHESLVGLLCARASAMGDKQVFSFVRDGGVRGETLTYQSLQQRAMAVAAELQSLVPAGARALLLFPPGLDFIPAFFGCLYAGVIAVPAAIPSRHRETSAVESIFQASQPSLILSTAEHIERAKRSYAADAGKLNCPWIAVDQIDVRRHEAWRDPHITGEQIAFLQYTSGSTSQPKGVMLSHDQILHNASLVQAAFHTTPESRAVFWLPLYHDMGLIGGVIQPVFCGGTSTLMAPASFLQRPALWLETISQTRSTIGGGPDFAYDLCSRKISAEERARLDLGCWEVAFLGAERIRPQTVDRFARAFSSCGFRKESLFPCYGLAEATLMVSGGPRKSPPVVLRVNAEALAENRVEIAAAEDDSCRVLVGCGENLRGQRVAIVDPETRRAISDGEVGEIWVRGPSVANGYYENGHDTAATFRACLADTGEGPFLRTGDLGFVVRGQLFVTGRLKNLIIIRGRNHYPEDIEQTVNSAYEGLRVGHCAAFSIEADDQEQLVVVQEVEPRRRDLNADAAILSIRNAVASRHELEVHAVALVKAGAVPKTSSGKTRRAACREKYLCGELEIIAAWTAATGDADFGLAESGDDVAPQHVSAIEIESWLLERITARLRLPAGEVKTTTPFLELGMSSLDAVEVAAALERWLGRRLSPTAIYNYPTIAALAHWLATPVSSEPSAVNVPVGEILLSPAAVNSDQLLAEVRGMSEKDLERFLAKELARH